MDKRRVLPPLRNMLRLLTARSQRAAFRGKNVFFWNAANPSP